MLPSRPPPEPGLPPLQPMPAGSLEGVVVVVPPFSEGQDAHLRLSSRVRKGPRAHTQIYIYISVCVYVFNFIHIHLLLFDCLLIYLVSIFVICLLPIYLIITYLCIVYLSKYFVCMCVCIKTNSTYVFFYIFFTYVYNV